MVEMQGRDGTAPRTRSVAVNGAVLAVFEYGLKPGPKVESVLLMHGYPDDHRLWTALIEHLAAEFHVIAYDSRNAGQSRVEVGGLAPFKIGYLVDDVFAVLDAVGVDRAHMVAHDWGSVQAWAAVRDQRAQQRLRSLLSISGPDLRHYRNWLKAALTSPGRWRQGMGQLVKSWYIMFFQLPKIPEMVVPRMLAGPRAGMEAGGLGSNAERGLALYRANIGLRWVRSSEFLRPTQAVLGSDTVVPVLMVLPTRDRFISVNLAEGVREWAPRTESMTVDGGHWWPASQAGELAQIAKSWIDSQSASPEVA